MGSGQRGVFLPVGNAGGYAGVRLLDGFDPEKRSGSAYRRCGISRGRERDAGKDPDSHGGSRAAFCGCGLYDT